MASEPDDTHVEVWVNRHRVLLRAGDIAGLELKQEAVAQGAQLQLGFDLWIKHDDRYAPVYNEDVVDLRQDQEYLALTSDDHAWPLPAHGRADGDPVRRGVEPRAAAAAVGRAVASPAA